MPDYRDIIRRLEEATGLNVPLDCDIHAAVVAQIPKGYVRGSSSGAYIMAHGRGGRTWSERVPPYTASLDSAIALVERMLPGCYRANGKTAAYPGMIPGSSDCKYWARVGDWGEPKRSYHDCEPIAILLSLFRALASEQGEKRDA